jgi:hypothetical protein
MFAYAKYIEAGSVCMLYTFQQLSSECILSVLLLLSLAAAKLSIPISIILCVKFPVLSSGDETLPRDKVFCDRSRLRPTGQYYNAYLSIIVFQTRKITPVMLFLK